MNLIRKTVGFNNKEYIVKNLIKLTLNRSNFEGGLGWKL